MKDDTVYLQHIAECIKKIEEDVVGGHDFFLASHTHQDAALRNLQTMTEASQWLSEELKAAHPEIEWPRLIAFRNVLVHNYLGIDMEIIWEIIQRDIPVLKKAILDMIGEKP